MRALPIFLVATLAIGVVKATDQQPSQAPDTPTIFAQAKAATVTIVAGEGAGSLHSISTGFLVSPDGALFTALHAVKDAAEVQVRLATGEVFDSVELLGTDERRGVAALRISAVKLPILAMGTTASLNQGDPIYAVTNSGGLAWSAVFIHSKTSFLTVDTLDRALALQKDWPKLDLTIVQDPRVADLVIEIDRPLFTYVHTFVIVDKTTSAVLSSGKVTAGGAREVISNT